MLFGFRDVGAGEPHAIGAARILRQGIEAFPEESVNSSRLLGDPQNMP
jgi:hypothetical protein